MGGKSDGDKLTNGGEKGGRLLEKKKEGRDVPSASFLQPPTCILFL